MCGKKKGEKGEKKYIEAEVLDITSHLMIFLYYCEYLHCRFLVKALEL